MNKSKDNKRGLRADPSVGCGHFHPTVYCNPQTEPNVTSQTKNYGGRDRGDVRLDRQEETTDQKDVSGENGSIESQWGGRTAQAEEEKGRVAAGMGGEPGSELQG